MTSLKFKYGFEWSALDDDQDYTYIADERNMAAYLSGNNAYAFCSGSYSPDVCHLQKTSQNTFANYDHYKNDPFECPSKFSEDVTYNVLDCQDDDYSKCHGPTHSHSRIYGLACTSSYSHHHHSCYQYQDCAEKYTYAQGEYNHYDTCTGDIDPEIPPLGDSEEVCEITVGLDAEQLYTTGGDVFMPVDVSDFTDYSNLLYACSPSTCIDFTPDPGDNTIYYIQVPENYTGDLTVSSSGCNIV